MINQGLTRMKVEDMVKQLMLASKHRAFVYHNYGDNGEIYKTVKINGIEIIDCVAFYGVLNTERIPSGISKEKLKMYEKSCKKFSPPEIAIEMIESLKWQTKKSYTIHGITLNDVKKRLRQLKLNKINNIKF